MDLKKELEVFNDSDFVFDPRSHRYTYGGQKYTSVTTFLKNFSQPFDQEYWSNKKAEELGVDKDQILKEWSEKNSRANFIGSQTHLWIENYYNRVYQEIPTDLDVVDRINKFNRVYATHLYKLTPIKFELRIFSKKYPIAGTIDSLFLYKNSLFIIDYKTNGDFKHDDHPKGTYSKLLPPFDEYWDNHHNQYSIQISLYSLILREWGFNIKGGYLLHIGPDSDPKMYKSHDFVSLLEDYMDSSSI